MSRQTSFKGLVLLNMNRREMEERMDELARKVEHAHKYYLKSRDDKKIVEELYELVRELEKLKKEFLGLGNKDGKIL